MLGQIDWDIIYNWKVFQVIKWIWLFVVPILIVLLIHQSSLYKTEKDSHEWTMTAMKKVLYDTRANDETLLAMLRKYVEQKEDNDGSSKE